MLEKEIYEAAGEEFNINSPKQLGVILFEKLGMPNAKRLKVDILQQQIYLTSLHLIILLLKRYLNIVSLPS